MRKNVEELSSQGTRPSALGIHARRPKREVAVHLDDLSKLGDTLHQGDVRRVAHLLVPRANEQPPLGGEGEELPGIGIGLDERLFDVHVGAGTEGRSCRLEVSSGWSCYMDEVRLGRL